MGIDPGTSVTGIGFIEVVDGGFELLKYRAVRTSSRKKLPERLKEIYRAVQCEISELKPDVCAIEEVFGGKNIRTALIIGQARGAAMMAAVNAGVDIAEYSPAEIKISLTGNGRASKEQVQYMVRSILRLNENPTPLDCSDALATAICHAHRMKTKV